MKAPENMATSEFGSAAVSWLLRQTATSYCA